MSETCAGGCGREKPQENASQKGWRRGLCRACYHLAQGYPPSTEKVRKYRQDPEKAERDRERSRAWKAANPERVRAYAREYKKRRSVTSAPAGKTPGNQSDPATAATVRGHGNQDRSS
jgi:hypothetical protein